MDTGMTLNSLEMRRMATVRTKVDEQARIYRLIRENERLLEENERLRQAQADLAGSAQIWIRLYEAALDRANRATAQQAGSGSQVLQVSCRSAGQLHTGAC